MNPVVKLEEKISRSTPVTIGLVLALVILAVSGGAAWGTATTKIDGLGTQLKQHSTQTHEGSVTRNEFALLREDLKEIKDDIKILKNAAIGRP